MKHNKFEIQVLKSKGNTRSLPAKFKKQDTTQYELAEKHNLEEELALALLGRFKEVENLKLRFMESGLTNKEKLNEIVRFKSALLVPALRSSLGLPIDFDVLRGSYDVLAILNSIEASISGLIQYEENEHIDFNHPKIVAGNVYLFELIIEIVSKQIQDQIIIRNIVEQVSIQTVGIENELNKLFNNVSSKIAQTMPNPLIEPYKNKSTNRQTILAKLAIDLECAKKAFNRDLSNAELIDKIDEILKELQVKIED